MRVIDDIETHLNICLINKRVRRSADTVITEEMAAQTELLGNVGRKDT